MGAALSAHPQVQAFMQRQSLSNAVDEARRRYPRLATIPLALTFNPNRAKNSETYQPDADENPVKGKWNVEMGVSTAAQPESWPELIALESLHALQENDPKYQKMAAGIIGSYSDQQLGQAYQRYNRDVNRYGNRGRNLGSFDNYLKYVDGPEFIRGGIWGDYFKKYEGGTWGGYSPEQTRMIDQIHQYLRSSD